MLNKISQKLASHLIKNQIISNEMFDLYVYGFELLLSFVFSTTILLLTGILFKRIIETICFLIVFIFLRSFSGGYHALTYLFCTFVTLFVYGSVMLLSYYLSVKHIAFFVLLPLGIITLFIFAPIKNPNKKVSVKKAKQYKITSICILAFFSIIGIIFHDRYPTLCNIVFYTLCADIILLFPKNQKKKGDVKNVCIPQ